MEDFDFVNLLYQVALYLGVAGFLMFIFSFLSGLRIIKTKPKLRLHKRIGIIGFLVVSIHALTMMYFYFLS